MTGKVLGKIESVEFGLYPDRPFLMGIQLTFKMGSGGIGCGGKYTVNISDACKWESEEEKHERFELLLKELNELLLDAKVTFVSELKNKPVEIDILNNTFKGFRILTEVL